MSRDIRVGLMGGSFDPIHLGHIDIAAEAKQALDLCKVLFIPSGNPPHKANLGANAIQRLEMTRLAIQNIQWARVCDVEVFRQGTIYTVDTLGILKERQPQTEFYYIIGADTLLDLPNWRNAHQVCTMCRFICVHRPGVDLNAVYPAMEQMRDEYHADVRLLAATGPDISSTEVRRRIQSGLSTQDMLSDAVRSYIDREKLYRS